MLSLAPYAFPHILLYALPCATLLSSFCTQASLEIVEKVHPSRINRKREGRENIQNLQGTGQKQMPKFLSPGQSCKTTDGLNRPGVWRQAAWIPSQLQWHNLGQVSELLHIWM